MFDKAVTPPSAPGNIILTAVLADDVFEKIGRRGDIRDAAKEAGVSVSTLNSILNEAMPSLMTLALLCKWLQRGPARYFDLGPMREKEAPPDED